MGAAETQAGHEEEYVDGTSAAPWPQLDGVRPKTSPALDDGRRSEDGEGRGGAKSNRSNVENSGTCLTCVPRGQYHHSTLGDNAIDVPQRKLWRIRLPVPNGLTPLQVLHAVLVIFTTQ